MEPDIVWLPQQLWPSWLNLSAFLVPTAPTTPAAADDAAALAAAALAAAALATTVTTPVISAAFAAPASASTALATAALIASAVAAAAHAASLHSATTAVITTTLVTPITTSAAIHTPANTSTIGTARRNRTSQGCHHPRRSFATWQRVLAGLGRPTTWT